MIPILSFLRMGRRHRRPRALRLGSFWPGLALGLLASVALAENTNVMLKPVTTVPGGLDPHPFITGLTVTQNTATVLWDGPGGPFQLQRSPSLAPVTWQNVGLPVFAKEATGPAQDSQGFLRVVGDEPTFVGAGLCVLCHREVHHTWGGTAHAQALKTLEDIGQGNNGQCLPCHTVGYGYANGFHDAATTARLANVQCENCHGPAVRHVENVEDSFSRPAVTPAAEVCGGCHNGFHHPTFDEWKTSGHARVDPEVAGSILAQGEPRMLACGPCHSGAVRLALLKQLEKPEAPLPSREDAAYFPIACAVCHEPHDQTGQVAQLRNPTYSTNQFSYSTAATTSFAQQYDPSIQMCGQCHNMRGARWQDTSRPPHHSPQYNLLVGQGGNDEGVSLIATHGLKIQQQCAQCHTHPHESEDPSSDDPNYTGHSFEVHYQGCFSSDPTVTCHPDGSNVELFVTLRQRDMQRRIGEVKVLLDQWATNKAPAELAARYGTLTWEYTNPGSLSNPDSLPTLRGPSTTEQTNVPPAIKQARMNLYLVEYDQSYGVHNARYARHLLGVAMTNVLEELKR